MSGPWAFGHMLTPVPFHSVPKIQGRLDSHARTSPEDRPLEGLSRWPLGVTSLPPDPRGVVKGPQSLVKQSSSAVTPPLVEGSRFQDRLGGRGPAVCHL